MKKILLTFILVFALFGGNTYAMHQSWDTNFDGINDCENDGTCDDSVDYTSPKIYKTSVDFLASEGDICKSATDGCNNVMIIDGQLGAMTKMYCEDIYGSKGQEKWSCNSYDTEKITPIIDGQEEDMRVCTMQYAPVCAEVQLQCIKAPCLPIQETFGNSCMAGKNPVLYTGECRDNVDVALFKRYQKYENYYLSSLENIKTDILEKGVEKADEMMEKAKLMRFAQGFLEKYVTKLVFVKELFIKELTSRY